MPAFSAAVALGYRYLETDVHATVDGVLVAFHDDDLSRTCGRPGRIAELPWSEVRAARVAGVEPIPLLTDLLEAFPHARFNIDCKADSAATPLMKVVRDTKAIDRVCLSTFSHRRIARLRNGLGRRLCTSMSPPEVAAWQAGIVVPAPGCAQVPPRQGRLTLVTARGLRVAHRAKLPVHVWTIDDEPVMDRLLDLGVDGIMTDRPVLLKQVLVRRGQWPG